MTAALLMLLSAGELQPPATIIVDAHRREGKPVPREFFGQFGEHLGANVYNGMWAQVLRNPGFEGYEYFDIEAEKALRAWGLPDVAAGKERGLACYWLPVGEAVYALDGDAFNSNGCQRMAIQRQGGIRTPVMLPLHRTRAYVLTFYARVDHSTAGRVVVTTADGVLAASARVRLKGNKWRKCATDLHIADGPRAGDLCYLGLVFDGPATVWIDQAELFPSDHVAGFDPDVLRLCREMRPSLLRFPGGNFASGYHWRDGIGPREKRVTRSNPAWGGIETNHVGTDEWIAFARAVGAEPLICVNCGDGTPQEAADWVRYCNEAPNGPLGCVRAANGHRTPYKVLWWEIGNELWGDWQIGHCTPEEYAARYDAFSKAMLEADPTIRIIANGGDGDWNQRFLRKVRQPVRSVSIHRLVGWDVSSEDDPADVFMALAAYGDMFEDELATMKRVMFEAGIQDPKAAVTELMSVAPIAPGLRTTNCIEEVFYFAGMMNACIRRRDFVELITRTALINHGGGLAKIREVVFPEPVHFLSRIYGTMSGCRPVACTVTAPTYNVAVKGLPAIQGASVLDCVALLDDTGKELTLLVTHRDARRCLRARIEVEGFAPTGQVRTRTITGDLRAFNVWDAPLRVSLAEARFRGAAPFEYLFPARSVTEMVLRASAKK